MRNGSSNIFSRYVEQEFGVECVAEYRFHPVRRWRMDWAIPSLRICIEQDGGVWTGGRHTRPVGYLRDLEKFNEAAAEGWLVLKFTPQNIFSKQAHDLIGRAINQKKI